MARILRKTNCEKLIANKEIDTELAMQRLGGKSQLYCNLLSAFLKHNRNHFGEIKNLIEQSHVDDACRMAHTIKRNAGNIGASALSELAAEIERLAEHYMAKRDYG